MLSITNLEERREVTKLGKLLEIRWHGRGGQGAKTGALLLGEVLVNTGKFMQAFPDYGPERMGAPMENHTRTPTSSHRPADEKQILGSGKKERNTEDSSPRRDWRHVTDTQA